MQYNPGDLSIAIGDRLDNSLDFHETTKKHNETILPEMKRQVKFLSLVFQ